MATIVHAGTPNVVSLRHEVDRRSSLLFVDWKLNNYCNYRCSYCRPQFHEGTVKGPPVSQIYALVEQISRQRSDKAWKHFHFTGGEPTAYEPLLEVLQELKRLGFTSSVITNGSKSTNWWKSSRSLLDEIFFTFHIEMTQRRHFTRVLSAVCGGEAMVHVNVTMLPTRFAECLDVANSVAASHTDASVSLKPLIQTNQELYPYTDEQKAVLRSWFKASVGRRFTRRAKSQMVAEFDDGRSELLPASRLISRGLNKFRGWRCNVGVETLAVTADGRIFRGNCRVGGQIGSLAAGLDEYPIQPVICTQDACFCAGDVCTEKRRVATTADAPLRSVFRNIPLRVVG
jgi:organic radical activating enzyme